MEEISTLFPPFNKRSRSTTTTTTAPPPPESETTTAPPPPPESSPETKKPSLRISSYKDRIAAMKEKARQRAQQKLPPPSSSSSNDEEEEEPIPDETTTTTATTTAANPPTPATSKGKFPTRVPSFKRPRPLRWKELSGAAESTTETSEVQLDRDPIESSTKTSRFVRPNRFRPSKTEESPSLPEESELDPVEASTKSTRFIRPNRFRPKTEKPLLPDEPELEPEPELHPVETSTKPTRFNRFRPVKTEDPALPEESELDPVEASSKAPTDFLPELSDSVAEWELDEPPPPPPAEPNDESPIADGDPIKATEPDPVGEDELDAAAQPPEEPEEPEELEELEEPSWDQLVNGNRRSSQQTFQMATEDPMLPIEELWNIRIRDDGKGM